MPTNRRVLFLVCLLLFPSVSWIAATVIGDGPVVRRHLDQRAIETGTIPILDVIEAGRVLFAAKFNSFDGQGRPGTTGGGAPRVPGSAPRFIRTSAPDANSCAGCHNDPSPGGAGDVVANVFVLSQTLDPVNPSVAEEFSNERNTLGMHGAGLIEMLAREMTAELQTIRDDAVRDSRASGIAVTRTLLAKGVRFGSITAQPDGQVSSANVAGVDADLVIRPFHQKGVVVSLREFTNNAYNHHHGMQSMERFGSQRTGSADFDQDGVPDELTAGDITAATIYQAALNTPGQVIPNDGDIARAIIRGERTFSRAGCTECHVPEMYLETARFSEPNPYNPAGNLRLGDVERPVTFDLATEGILPRPEKTHDGKIVVRAFTDLKRHNLCDEQTTHFCNEKLIQGGVPTPQFLTRKLWDCGSTAPFGHRGDLTTATEVIAAHGGEARASRLAFQALPKREQDEVVEFLKSLQILPEGTSGLVVDEKLKALDKEAVTRTLLPERDLPERDRDVRP